MKLKYLFFLPWLFSIFATLGSLYFSEVKGFVPCDLCWYQRILMYPLIVLFAFGFVRRDSNVYLYTLPLSIGGALLALYHYLLQKVPFLQEASICSTGVPCSGEYINIFGFITIPFLSLVAFILISIVSFILVRRRSEDTND